MKRICWRYYHFTQVYHKPQSYMMYSSRETERKTKFWKSKKASGDVIILNLYNKKHNQMYAYSDMEWGRHHLLSS